MTNQISKFLARRKLLVGLAAGAVAAGALAAPALRLSWTRQPGRAGGWWDRMFYSLERGGYGDWNEVVGSDFKLAAGNGTATVKLVEVKPFRAPGRLPDSVGRERAFAAVFETGAGTAPAADGIYALDHARHGAMKLFMTAGDTTNNRMEAVFG